jgi:hypothetical protein
MPHGNLFEVSTLELKKEIRSLFQLDKDTELQETEPKKVYSGLISPNWCLPFSKPNGILQVP